LTAVSSSGIFSSMSIDAAKKAVGIKAAEFIENGMVVGLGTGSTAHYFIERLIQRCKEGLKIQAVASSERSLKQAEAGKIPMIDINSLTRIDITVDGADEIDSEKRMIKGGGGALLREKIVATMSEEMVVIIDETKLVSKLGKQKLPVEIIPFGHQATIYKLNHLGFSGTLRYTSNGKIYITDNGNFLFDLQLDPNTLRLPDDHERMLQIPGVVDTGFFLNAAGRVVIGFLDGQVVIQ
jgi:ribose 5-phosphate isomerase A